MPRTVPTSIPVIKADMARRMLLGCQGLLDDPARRATSAALNRLIEQMGFVQIDTINVIERAHHLTLFSRLDEYRQPMLANLLEQKRQLWEHWTHDASAIPTKWFGHWRHRFERYRVRIKRHEWWAKRMGDNPAQTVREVKERIVRDGPVLSKDFEHDRQANGQLAEEGWWGWKPQKAALEYLWRSGELAVSGRINFQKVYDLVERVLPEHCAAPAPEIDAHVDWACRSALERLGFASPAELAAFWHAIDLSQARRWCEQAVRSGQIVQVMVEGLSDSKLRPAFALPDFEQRAARLSDAPRRTRLLSPFDPVLRDRKRALRLFDFDYAFEAFVPAAKRRYGYYVLPILEADRLIGRLDPKFHRDRGVLEIKGLWWEQSIKPTKPRRHAAHEAIERMARFIGASKVQFSNEAAC